MRILLAANASYVTPRGGATRSNLAWLSTLAASGHECRVISALLHDDSGRERQLREEEIEAEGGALRVLAAADPAGRAQLLRDQVRDFHPDWVLVSSEDVGQLLLREAVQAAPGRVVYLAHTPQFFPFGPAAWSPNPAGSELVKGAAAVIAIGRHMADYIRRHLGREAVVIHPPIYGRGPFPQLGSLDNQWILMINPSAVKGLPIFLALADRFPQYRFGALTGWGTTSADRAALAARHNVELLANVKHIEQVLARTRVLLMPSLWYEGFGLIVVEAMLRGIPVVASDSGGLVEAKLGTRFVIPVPALERYEAEFDEHGLPRAVLPPIDIEPWAEALSTLLSGRPVYKAEAEASRQAALRFVESLHPAALEEFLRARPRLRILLAHNSTYYPAHGGGDKSNRLLLEAHAARGHTCRVVARTASYGTDEQRRYFAELTARGIKVLACDAGVVSFRLNGVEVHTVTNTPNIRAWFAAQIESFAPDVIVSSTDDPAQLLLETALEADKARVVYLARATLALPFGPDCAFASEGKTTMLRQADGAVGVSQYVADYMHRYGSIDAVHHPISLMEPGPWPTLGRFDNEFVTLVNPCAVKGISIFLALAGRMPEVRFGAVPTWGTNRGDLAALKAHPNITVLDPADNIDDILRRTRVLLVPSLWAEARSRIVVEAMLRGVPVVASDIGGIPEAKLGVPYLLPVRPIVKYRSEVDEQMVPVAEVPEQDIGPWQGALARLLREREHWEEMARVSRVAARRYAENLSVEPFERFLIEVVRRPRRARGPVELKPPGVLERLSPEKRHLLALLLRKKWFAATELHPGVRLRLFCFPHAGGGATAFQGWVGKLGASVAVCPARLPGRESRASEAPFQEMGALVDALAGALLPYSSQPMALFGHSMGAGVAFEVARTLRRRGRPLPAALFVSAARAPQLRRAPAPPPPDQELIEQLHRLRGMDAQALQDPEILRMLLPTLRADTTLYRNYVYREEAPLPCPIFAYGGEEDPNLGREHLEAWAAQTTASFRLRLFPGGHFYLRERQEQFLQTLAADLAEYPPPPHGVPR